MDLGLKGKTAIVTGGSKGIGRASALLLAREGAEVVVSARGAEAVEAVAAEIKAEGGVALGFPGDTSTADGPAAIVAGAIERFGKVDILVNNAGGQRTRAGFDDLTDQDFLDAYADNVLSVVRMVRAALPGMRERKWGRIINIVSEVSTQPERVFQHYNAAKAAELNLTKSLSKALARDGVLVNAVAPGLISTVAVEESFARGARDQGRPIEAVKADFFRKFKTGVVLGRAGEASEVAGLVAFLASDFATYVTGANFRVDGGAVVGIEAMLDAEDFKTFIDSVRRFVRERLVPAEAAVIEADRVPDGLLDEMREMGLFGMSVPPEYGGSGLSTAQFVEAVLELAWAAPAFRSAMSIGSGVVTTALKLDGTEAQRDEWLPRLAAGEIASFGLTEPDSGSDSAGMRTRAVRDGDSYVLNGSKRYITNAPQAGFVLMMARTSAETLPGNAHVSAFLMPTNLPGVSIGKPDKKMGQRGALTADIVMQDVRLPASALVGGIEGRGFKTAMKALDGGRLSVAAGAIGYARRILDSGLRYATERKAFGETIANFQLIQAMIADSEAEIYASECMLRDAAARFDAGERISTKAACVKMFASEMCSRIADRVVQIHGGAGYMAEYEAERFYRDSRVYRIYEGTTQILQLVIARGILKEFAETGVYD